MKILALNAIGLPIMGAAMMAAVMPSAAHADSFAYCQALAGFYSFDINPDAKGVQNTNTSSSSCIANAAYAGAFRSNVSNSLIHYGETSGVSADLATGSIKLETSAFIGDSPGTNGSAFGSLWDYMTIIGTSNGQAILSLKFDGIIGPAGQFGLSFIVEGGNTVAHDSLGYKDPAYFGGTSFTSSINNGVYDAAKGELDIPIDYYTGNNRYLVYLVATAIGNASFGHTVGIQLALPDGASYTSDSGIFLTQPQDNISGGVTFGPTAGSVPEPTAWAMMVGGFGLLGLKARRSRSTVGVFV